MKEQKVTKEHYLYKSGNLTLRDGKIFKDILCLDYNDTEEIIRGMPSGSLVIIDKNVRVVCLRFSDIQAFKVDRREPRNWVPNYAESE